MVLVWHCTVRHPLTLIGRLILQTHVAVEPWSSPHAYSVYTESLALCVHHGCSQDDRTGTGTLCLTVATGALITLGCLPLWAETATAPLLWE